MHAVCMTMYVALGVGLRFQRPPMFPSDKQAAHIHIFVHVLLTVLMLFLHQPLLHIHTVVSDLHNLQQYAVVDVVPLPQPVRHTHTQK